MSAGCSGAAGEQTAVTAQYDTLGQTLLDLYTREFIAAWREALAQAAAAPAHGGQAEIHRARRCRGRDVADQATAGIIRDETALTRERPEAAAQGGAAAAATPPAGCDLLRQQDRAPGTAIEAAFKAFHVLVEGEATRRPIDAIVANLNEIHQSLTLLATNPSQAALANASLQTQVASLRANANRLPRPVRRPAAQGRRHVRRRS